MQKTKKTIRLAVFNLTKDKWVCSLMCLLKVSTRHSNCHLKRTPLLNVPLQNWKCKPNNEKEDADLGED